MKSKRGGGGEYDLLGELKTCVRRLALEYYCSVQDFRLIMGRTRSGQDKLPLCASRRELGRVFGAERSANEDGRGRCCYVE